MLLPNDAIILLLGLLGTLRGGSFMSSGSVSFGSESLISRSSSPIHPGPVHPGPVHPVPSNSGPIRGLPNHETPKAIHCHEPAVLHLLRKIPPLALLAVQQATARTRS